MEYSVIFDYRDGGRRRAKLELENKLDYYYRLLKHIDNIPVYKNADIVQLFEERQKVVRKINELTEVLNNGMVC